MIETARAWYVATLPASLHELAESRLAQWQDHQSPAPVLWRLLADLCSEMAAFEPAIATLRRGLQDDSQDPGLLADLSVALTRIGADGEAEHLRDLLPKGHPARLEPVLAAIEAGRLADTDEIRTLLLARADWSKPHDRVTKAMRLNDQAKDSALFAGEWMRRHGANAVALVRAGEALLEFGLPDQARSMLAPARQVFESEIALMIGPAQADIPPIDAVITRIEQALAAPANPPWPLPGADLPAETVRVLYVGPQTTGGREAFANDLAGHFAATAEIAGGLFDSWLDDATGKPAEARVSDQFIAQRVAALGDHIDATRPDIVILDCCWAPAERGLSREVVADWRDRFGFRLTALFRDALKDCLPLIEFWQTIADGILLFDPLSPALAAFPDKAVAIPVPALHPPFAPSANDDGLLFIGGLAQSHRVMLLAELAGQPVPLRLLVGPERQRRTRRADDYAACLAGARMSLNIATHHQSECLVTGRVWESIACGAVLFEQAGSGTASFFTPWRHYLPWSHQGDIVGLVQALDSRDDLRREIAKQALDFACGHYGAKAVWQAILAKRC